MPVNKSLTGATRGSWQVARSIFDQRRNGKAGEGENNVADAEAAAEKEPEFFGGVAAE